MLARLQDVVNLIFGLVWFELVQFHNSSAIQNRSVRYIYYEIRRQGTLKH